MVQSRKAALHRSWHELDRCSAKQKVPCVSCSTIAQISLPASLFEAKCATTAQPVWHQLYSALHCCICSGKLSKCHRVCHLQLPFLFSSLLSFLFFSFLFLVCHLQLPVPFLSFPFLSFPLFLFFFSFPFFLFFPFSYIPTIHIAALSMTWYILNIVWLFLRSGLYKVKVKSTVFLVSCRCFSWFLSVRLVDV